MFGSKKTVGILLCLTACTSSQKAKVVQTSVVQTPVAQTNIEQHRRPSSVEIPEEFFVPETDLDKDLGEAFEEGDFNKERQYITGVANTFVKFILEVQAKSPNGPTFRGAHAKALACLKGEFRIRNQDLPKELQVGIFSNNKSFPAWIRISNSSQDPFSPDKSQNTRGFAVKLFGVDGPKLLDSQQDSNTLDLLNVAAEAFVARDNYNYSEIADGSESPLGLVSRLGVVKSARLLGAVMKAQKEANPLKLDYFSTVSYRLGTVEGPKRAIKFRTVLCDPVAARKFPVSNYGQEYLVKNISDTLNSTNEVCYNFQIQFAKKGDNVEDATAMWLNPYVTAAQLIIKKENNPAETLAGRASFCEQLTFNPWRTTAIHKPLGRINRARKATYQISTTLRHTANNSVIREPDIKSFDEIP